MTGSLLVVENVARHYRLPRAAPWRKPQTVPAVDGVSFTMEKGESLGIVGESGSGKSTLARLIMAFERPSTGTVTLLGREFGGLSVAELRKMRRHFQMVFQDPYGSLDPRHKVGRIVGEPLSALEGAGDGGGAIAEALSAVGLKPADAAKYPHEFSGGQRQRIAIARALITRPALIVADEPVSALDVSVQAQVLNLMRDLQQAHGVTYLFISHDLRVVEFVTEQVAVMFLGRIVETGPTAAVFAAPRHPYTQALKAAVPGLVPGRRRADRTSRNSVDQSSPPSRTGCAFASRCPRVEARCRAEAPSLRELQPGRSAACHFA